MSLENFIKKFKIPEAAYSSIDKIFTKEEIHFVDKMDKHFFVKQDVENIINGNADEFIKSCYKRGIISLEDEAAAIYKIADFYSRLDIFSIYEQEVYRSIPAQDQIAMDEWYFEAYYKGLDPDPDIRPTKDEIMPLNKVLDFIDKQQRPVYLNYCDCRSLRGGCGKPVKTCITYKNGINSFAHRGLSEKITKERAKEIVKYAEREGLMHTVNPNGICNCCGDCCYLFRGQKKRGSSGFWPKSELVVQQDFEKCIQCGACIRKCHFSVFNKKDGFISADILNCVGCGICVNTCPVKALNLISR